MSKQHCWRNWTCNESGYMESPCNGVLPIDIIQEILWRLPVKTLLQFKCVCKQWCTLIGSPTFVNQHFSHKSNPEGLLIWYDVSPENRVTSALYADELGSQYEEPSHLQMPDGCHLYGPLNGVFFVGSLAGDYLALFNPAMRQFRPIPSHGLNYRPNPSTDHLSMNGIGFDPLSGIYTLIATRVFSDDLGTGIKVPPNHVCIYNSGRDSWRYIENVDLATKIYLAMTQASRNVCLDGVLYWRTWNNVDGASFIFALDSSENFHEIKVPDCIKYIENTSLIIYGDSIALLSCSTDLRTSTWVMKEVGCWTKSFTIGPIEGLKRPICSWKSDVLVFETEDDTSVTLYNVSTGILRKIEFQSEEEGRKFFLHALPYKDSLVSIKGEGDSCKLWDTSSRVVKDWFSQKRF